jgi:hypothetical protein
MTFPAKGLLAAEQKCHELEHLIKHLGLSFSPTKHPAFLRIFVTVKHIS